MLRTLILARWYPIAILHEPPENNLHAQNGMGSVCTVSTIQKDAAPSSKGALSWSGSTWELMEVDIYP